MAISRSAATIYDTGNSSAASHAFDANIPTGSIYAQVLIGTRLERALSYARINAVDTVDLAGLFAHPFAANHRIWSRQLADPTTGAAVETTIAVESPAGATAFSAAVVPYEGVDTTTPEKNNTTAYGDAATHPSITVTSAEGELVQVFLMVQRSSTVTTDDTGAGVTEIFNFPNLEGSVSAEITMIMAEKVAGAGSTTTLTFTLSDTGNPRAWVAQGWVLNAAVTAPDPATISREPADIAAGKQTHDTAHTRVGTVDATAGNETDLWISTTNHGEDAEATWEANATEFGTIVSANDLVAATGLTPNTPHYIVAITTDGSGNKTQSTVLTITTAYAKPTSPTVVSKTSSTATISWTDATGGVAPHQLFQRESADPLSALEFKATVPAGETLQYKFEGLTEGTEYSFEAVAWDGDEGGAGRYSGLVAAVASTNGAVSIPVLAARSNILLQPGRA